MTSADIALLVGSLISAWAVGFVAGFVLTKFKDAVGTVV